MSSSSSSSTADAKRKAEIEAKKAKLLEIRRQREQRAQRLQASTSSTSQSAGAGSSTPGATSGTSTSKKDLDDLVNALISGSGTTGTSATRSSRASIIGSPATGDFSPRKSLISRASGFDPPSSEFGESEIDSTPLTPGAATATTAVGGATGTGTDAASTRDYPVQFVDAEIQATEPLPLKERERVYYTKEVQTTESGTLNDDEYDDEDEDDYDGVNGPQARTANGRTRRDGGGVGAEARLKETEQSIRARILAEHAQELAARQEEDRLEREIQEQLRELTDAERIAVYSAQDFGDFVEQSSKIVERALADSYDYMRDYRILDSDGLESSNSGSQIRLHRTFASSDKLFENRSITAIDWSTKYPELVVAAYNRNSNDQDSPDGLVAVWNLHLRDRPEFVFHAQTDVLSVCFSPFHPNLVIGGTYSGQILIWDTRARSLPVLKTPLSAAGHTHPVYGLKLVGSANAHNLVSASTDGSICWWMMDMLARPSESLELLNPLHPKTDEVAITALGVPDQETTSFLVATEEGNVYSANRYDRAGLKAGFNANEVYRGHLAPVTGIDFHPLSAATNHTDFSDLFLTSSMDWTVKLWRLKSSSSSASTTHPVRSAGTTTHSSSTSNTGSGSGANSLQSSILTFEESNDYVYDVKWSPTHPAVFGQVDATGRIDIFNLNADTERPVSSGFPSLSASSLGGPGAGAGGSGPAGSSTSTVDPSPSLPPLASSSPAKALNKLSFAKSGKFAATAGTDGRLYIYELPDSLVHPTDDDVATFQITVAHLLARANADAAALGSNPATNPSSNATYKFAAASASTSAGFPASRAAGQRW
ncbi:WD40 repeat-like protein [Testicularia cyperi]|uniref:WD40 repeat-like protein n=1 Tax=Testicularia cyperi TaxID=1882483 RepID=A0A317XKX0_9BASI|nr:WD40 repeat-like protein [Testicularia cyperi]